MAETIHIAQVNDFAKPPTYTTAPAPPAPGENETQVRLLATGVHRLVRSRAAGKHYSAQGVPHIPGVDGVGTRVSDNKLVYWVAISPKGGSMQEVLNVPTSNIVELSDGVDAENVAAMVNPAMSSWMALKYRTTGLEKGFTVVILGVTSASGRVGVSVAKEFGAAKVIGVARNEASIKAIEGVDEALVLKDNPEDSDWAQAAGADVVLDYLYGKPALALLTSPGLGKGRRVQYLQIGSVAGEVMDLPSAVLRSKVITMTGSGPGSWGLQQMQQETPQFVRVAAGLKRQKLKTAKLADIEKVWDEGGNDRLVVVP